MLNRAPISKTPCWQALLASLVLLLLVASPVKAQLQANFTVDKTGGCSPLSVHFTNTSTGTSAGTTWSWTMGNDNTSTLQHAAAIYTTEKDFTVTLTATDGNQTSTKSITVTVYKKPEIDFSPNIVKGCEPLLVNFTATGQPGDAPLTSCYWDFGDGATNEVATTSFGHVYQGQQLATVSLTAKNSYGCQSTVVKQNLVEILPNLSADFTTSQRVLCNVSDAVQFTNKSKGPGTLTYAWDFGNGETSADLHPLHAFNTSGTYSVKLTTTSSEGCVATKTYSNLLNVANYSTDIEMPILVCKDAYVNFQSVCTPTPASLSWWVDGNNAGGNPVLNLSFPTTGNHTVTLKAMHGSCLQTVTKSFTVEALPAMTDFVFDIKDPCGPPALVNFKDVGTDAVKWEWDFNFNGWQAQMDAFTKDPSYTFTAENTYTVLMKVHNAAGCTRTTTKQVYIAKPVAGIRRIDPNPFNNVVSCGPVTLSFRATTTETITKYNWIFDNGAGTASVAEPGYTFSTPGLHTVRLEFETNKGCKGTAWYEYQIDVRTTPKADFTSMSGTTVCGNNRVDFKSQTTGQFGYEYWYINGNYTGSSYYSFFDYKFNEKGKYTIMMVADNYGCRDTITKVDYITVLPPFPRISGVKNSCEERDKVVFSQESRYAEKWIWDFGDGQTQTFTTDVASLTHRYAATGTYKVVLTTTNGQCSVRDSTFAYVFLKPTPLLSSTQTEICRNQSLPITLSNIPQTPYPDVWVYYTFTKWEYGDGSTFLGYDGSWGGFVDPLPYKGQLSLLNGDKDKIRVIVQETGFGCADTSNFIPFKVKGSAPGFQFVKNNVCYTDAVELKNTSVVSAGSAIKKWTWDWGDGLQTTNTTGENVTHKYASPGEYPLTLTITDDIGCTSYTNTTINTPYARVNGPKAAFYASVSVTPVDATVTFYNNTNDYQYFRATYTWDFGDGTTATGYSVQHKFSTVGLFTVKLTATDLVTGCTSEATTTITVEPVKAAFETTRAFMGQNNCLPVLASFSAIYVNANNLKWDFGDGVTAADVRSPKHVYEKPGRYIVRLTATGTNGLPLLFIDSVIIPEAKVNFSAISWKACAGYPITWQLTGTNTSNFVWDYGDGSTGLSQNGTHVHTYAEPGTYAPSLLMKDANGCVTTAVVSNKVIIHPKPTIQLSPAPAAVCEGRSLKLTATGGNSYVWSPTTAIDNVNSQTPTVMPAVSTTYKVLVTDANGCTNEKELPVTVHHPIALSLDGDTTLCQGDSKTFIASGAHHYAWIDHTEGLSSLQSASPKVTPAASGMYTLVGYDAPGCFTDTAVATITVNPRPVPDAGKDVEIEAGKKVPLQATAGTETVTWTWSPATYLSCSNCAAPVCIPLADTKYTATATNMFGCAASDDVVVKLVCDESKVRIPNGFTPNGDGNNDLFVIKGISFVKHLTIYNRWGNKVFERHHFVAADAGASWDGSLQGIPQPTGTYVYFIEMQCDAGGIFTRKGTITLIR